VFDLLIPTRLEQKHQHIEIKGNSTQGDKSNC